MAVDVMAQLRLDKYLADMGIGTRSQIKEAAKKGRIQVNGQTEKKTDRKITPGDDQVIMDGQVIGYVHTEYYMLNKPQGVVSATEDRKYQTVVDLIADRQRKDLFPVGRLDIDTEGLLLITNDGELAHRLLSPAHHVDKQYYALVEGELPADAVSQMEQGVTLEDGTVTRPARLELLPEKEGEFTKTLLTIHEGKFHQVKRMFEALGCKVVFLKRLSMGNLVLDPELETGAYRPLTEGELKNLRNCSIGLRTCCADRKKT